MRLRSVSLSFLIALASVPAARAQCPGWTRGFAGAGANLPVRAVCEVSASSVGAGVYIGGDFTDVGALPASHVARWNGSAWSVLASGTDGSVQALLEHDDGSGPALFAGGHFARAGYANAASIARWNGVSWSTLGSGIQGRVFALCSFDDGSGPALYAAGSFTLAGGASASNIARWDGSSWSALGAGTDAPIHTLCVFDDGSGAQLYAGGEFTQAGGASASYLARWNGAAWSTVGGGTDNWVRALAVYDEGSGARLFAAGDFGVAGGQPGNHIARWNGASWSGVGNNGLDLPAHALATWTVAGSTYLVAGGEFNNAGMLPAARAARWNGTAWGAVFGTMFNSNPTVDALAAASDGTLYAAIEAGPYVRRTSTLAPFANFGPELGLDSPGLGLCTFDEGAGPALFVTGTFTHAGGTAANRIARWNGTSFSALGSGLGGSGGLNQLQGETLCVHDDGAGAALYVGGHFTQAGGVSAKNVARWDGTSWTALGTGAGDAPGETWVHALCSYDAGSGAELYAGGYYFSAGGQSATCIARWDGSAWHALPNVIVGSNPPTVYALAVHDDGSGPALYAGGVWNTVNGVTSYNIARWDGSAWSPVPGLPSFAWVYALCEFDDGSGGVKLFAATNGGVYRLDGASWTQIAAAYSTTLAVFDDGSGSGPALWASRGPASNGGLARWNGTSWTTTGLGLDGAPFSRTLLAFDDGRGRALFATGGFQQAGGILAQDFARLDACGPATSFCAADGIDAQVTTHCPCENAGAEGRGCANSVHREGGRLEAGGSTALDPSSGTDTLVLTASSILSTSIFLQGDAQISAGALFADGVRCTGGHLVRLGVKPSSGGVSSYPGAGDLSISQRGGVTPGSGAVRYYQAYYRNPDPLWCPAGTYNITSGQIVVW